MTFLLDVNVLIALLDTAHIDHERATQWFEAEGFEHWATCPIVQNGVVRIIGGAGYKTVSLSCAEVADTLSVWCQSEGHEFWPDDLSLVADGRIDRSRLVSPGRITDSYLLALAVHRGGKLATLDRRLSAAPVEGGTDAVHLIV